jgi:hypothetical protein
MAPMLAFLGVLPQVTQLQPRVLEYYESEGI